MKKKKCKCKEKPEIWFGVYYHQGEIEEADERMILKALKHGAKVYHQFTHVYFKEGNHDFWLERYLLNNARDAFKALGIGLKTLLKLGELRVEHIHNLKYIKYGDLDIVHGHEFMGMGSGKFPATGLLDRWQTFKGRYDVKILAGHHHRTDKALSKKSKDGKFGNAWTVPAMCRKGPSYSPYGGANQGWAELEFNDGNVIVNIKEV